MIYIFFCKKIFDVISFKSWYNLFVVKLVMRLKFIISSFLNNPYVNKYFSMLKTESWHNLTDEEKISVYNGINKCFCDSLNLKCYDFIVNKNSISSSNEDVFSNVNFKNNKIEITDISYNQYLTLFEYFSKTILRFQKKVCFSNCSSNSNESELGENWKKDLEIFRLGPFSVSYNGEIINEFSNVMSDSKKFCENILFNIIKNNYDYSNCCYDEELFMNDSDILLDKSIVKVGKYLYKSACDKKKVIKNSLMNISNKMKRLREMDDLSECDEKDLFYTIYPDVVSCLDVVSLVKIYNELAKRICDSEIVIEYVKNTVIINDSVYKSSLFKRNCFNILLDECLKKMESDFLKVNDVSDLNTEEFVVLKNNIKSFKRKWMYGLIDRVDYALSNEDFGVVNYSILFLLFNKSNFNKYLNENTLSDKVVRRK